MAKGLFSWLGLDRKDHEKQEQAAGEQPNPPPPAQPAAARRTAQEPQGAAGQEAGARAQSGLQNAEAQESLSGLADAGERIPDALSPQAVAGPEPAVLPESSRNAAQGSASPASQTVTDGGEAAAEPRDRGAAQAEADAAARTAADGGEAAAVQERGPDADQAARVQVKRTWFERLKKTRQNLGYGLAALIVGKKIDDELYEDLETALLTADLGVETTTYVIERLKEESRARELHDAAALKANLKRILIEILKPCERPLKIEKQGAGPYVILMVGVNGAGKTTTIGKLALKYKARGLKIMLGAGDTFRAAAVEQLRQWGERTATPVVSQPTGSDSASVLFDALSSARARGMDVLICDTAGRLQNKDNLMEELKKIVRVLQKQDPAVPQEILLVLDATTGQNAVSQMKLFNQAVQVTGIALTKLDGSAKGGVIFALADKFKVPLRYVGIGEKTEDLREFDAESFVGALLEDGN